MEVQVRDSAGRVCGTLNTLLLYYLGIKLLVIRWFRKNSTARQLNCEPVANGAEEPIVKNQLDL